MSGKHSDSPSDKASSISKLISYNMTDEEIIDYMLQLQSFVEKELQKPEYKHLTMDQLFNDKQGVNLWRQILAAAEEARNQTPINLPVLQSSGVPKKHTMANSFLANELQYGGIIDAGSISLPILGTSKQAQNNGKLITTSVIATYQPGEEITIHGDYTEYDRQVQEAIYNLWLYGDQSHTFTPNMVYRTMINNVTANPSAQRIEAVTQSIEKQRLIYTKIDASAEMARRGITDAHGNPIQYKVGDFLLSLRSIEVKAGGQTVQAYVIKSEPLLLEYSRLTGQLLTVKSDLLDIHRIDDQGTICESIANTEGRIAIKGYLLRRIEILKHDIKQAKTAHKRYSSRCEQRAALPEKTLSSFRRQSNRILFESIFNATAQKSTDRKTAKRNREYILQCLEYWKATHYIQDYAIAKGEKGRIRGIDIFV